MSTEERTAIKRGEYSGVFQPLSETLQGISSCAFCTISTALLLELVLCVLVSLVPFVHLNHQYTLPTNYYCPALVPHWNQLLTRASSCFNGEKRRECCVWRCPTEICVSLASTMDSALFKIVLLGDVTYVSVCLSSLKFAASCGPNEALSFRLAGSRKRSSLPLMKLVSPFAILTSVPGFILSYSAGKTALLSQFAYKHFKENYKATIGSGSSTPSCPLHLTPVELSLTLLVPYRLHYARYRN